MLLLAMPASVACVGPRGGSRNAGVAKERPGGSGARGTLVDVGEISEGRPSPGPGPVGVIPTVELGVLTTGLGTASLGDEPDLFRLRLPKVDCLAATLLLRFGMGCFYVEHDTSICCVCSYRQQCHAPTS